MKYILFAIGLFSLTLFARDNRVINAQGALANGNPSQAYFDLKNRVDHHLGGYAAAAQVDSRKAAKAEANGNTNRSNYFTQQAETQLQNAEAYRPQRFQNDPYSSSSFFNH